MRLSGLSPAHRRDTPAAGIHLALAFLIACVVHACEVYQSSSFDFDKVNHVAATISWLHGRGFTIPGVGAAGLPQTARICVSAAWRQRPRIPS